MKSWNLLLNRFGHPLSIEYILQTKVNKFTISYILGMLVEVERALSTTPTIDLSPKRRSYRIFKRWIVSESFLSTELLRRVARRPSKTWGTISSFTDMLNARFLAPRLTATFGFEAAYVKSNLRTFYFSAPTPFTVKIFPVNDGCVSNVENELQTRKKVTRLVAGLSIPGITHSRVDADPPFFAENLVLGRKPTKESDLIYIHRLLDGIWDLYRSCGIDFESAREWMPPQIESIDSLFQSLGIEAIATQYKETISVVHHFLLRIQDGYYPVPVSLGHGDLTISNMLRSNGVLYLLDWERSARMPIAFDLAKIALISDQTARLCEENNAALHWPAEGHRLSFKEQIALYSARELINIDDRYNSTFRQKYNTDQVTRSFVRKHLRMLSEILSVGE